MNMKTNFANAIVKSVMATLSKANKKIMERLFYVLPIIY